MNIKQLAYFCGYGFKTFVLRQRKPIIAGMPLTDVCNLQCKHCVVANTGRGHYPFAKIEELMRHFYAVGVRILYIQGGEIMTWQEGSKNVNDVIRLARKIGFFKVAMVTNGTIGIDSEADLIWVSIDGGEKIHDDIRGTGAYQKVIGNLQRTKHPRVYLNMTINKINAGEVETVAKLARDLATVKGVSFNFHTPYPGVEDICLPLDERAKVIDRILNLKRQGYPILNTTAGLQAMQINKWKRPIPIINLVEKDRIFECCWGREQKGVCEKCGYAVIAELSQVLSFNMPTMLQSLSLFK